MKFGQKIKINWRSNIRETPREIEAFCQMLEEDQGLHRHSDGLWWFYDETGADEFGGYVTKQEALESAKRYGEALSLRTDG